MTTFRRPSPTAGADAAAQAPPVPVTLTHRPGRWIDGWNPETPTFWESGGPRDRAPQPRLVDLRRVPRLHRLAAVEHRRRDAARRRLRPSPARDRSGSSRFRASSARPCGSPTRSWSRSFGGRNWTIDLGGAAADPRDRCSASSWATPRPRSASCSLVAAPRRLRRRQLRQLDGEHHLLLPAEGEGLGARPQRRRRQPRHLGRPVRRADRRHDRRRRDAQHLRSPAGCGSRSSSLAMWGAWRYMDNLSSREGRLRGVRRGPARAAPVDHGAALHRHLRLVHRLRERLPEAHRRPVPRVLDLPGRAGRRSRSRSSARSSARSPARTAAGSPTGSAARASPSAPSRSWRSARSPLVWTLPLQNFWVFLGCFLVLFAATGIGNGSTYRMIPNVFAGAGHRDRRAARHAGGRQDAAQGGRGARPHLGDRRVRRLRHPAGAERVAAGDRRLHGGVLRLRRRLRRLLLTLTILVYVVPRQSLAGQRI